LFDRTSKEGLAVFGERKNDDIFKFECLPFIDVAAALTFLLQTAVYTFTLDCSITFHSVFPVCFLGQICNF